MEEKANTGPTPGNEATPGKATAVIGTTNAVIIALLAVIIVMAAFMAGTDEDAAPVAQATAAEMPTPAATTVAMPAPATAAGSATAGGIERKGEGRLFFRTIKIPAGAETLYLSGSGAAQKPDGTWGNMEEQAIDTFKKFKATLEEEGWSMADIVQVRAFAVAGDYGLLDFDGFNRGYSRFFGTQENPAKPVRSFVQVADLVVDGWLVEIEIRAARMPQ